MEAKKRVPLYQLSGQEGDQQFTNNTTENALQCQPTNELDAIQQQTTRATPTTSQKKQSISTIETLARRFAEHVKRRQDNKDALDKFYSGLRMVGGSTSEKRKSRFRSTSGLSSLHGTFEDYFIHKYRHRDVLEGHDMCNIPRASVEWQEQPDYLQPIDKDGNYPWKEKDSKTKDQPKSVPGPSKRASPGSERADAKKQAAGRVKRKRKLSKTAMVKTAMTAKEL
ncbi:hypothetical protein BGZ80_002945 [Entomortierella chlamydospora]|uniref:Uncharacterized protein n=1 Tax=Entomortierella chlamydospora TaxID=101097 RepID=A0A9P6SWZ3_9FUNG|nr:hypothetical protein BGZ80_002945 [Entomortierella chlamydospora]